MADYYPVAARRRDIGSHRQRARRSGKPASSVLRQQLILALLSVALWTVLLICWMAWVRSNPLRGEPAPGSGDFFTSVMLTFGSESYEIRYRVRGNRLRLGDLARLWGVPTAQRCREATLITWETRGIRALLEQPESQSISVDAPISFVSFSPLRAPSWAKQVGRCHPARVDGLW